MRATDADALAADPLTPIRETLRHMDSRPDMPALGGLAPDLTVTDPTGWVPATEIVSGAALDPLLAAARQRWRAAPHAPRRSPGSATRTGSPCRRCSAMPRPVGFRWYGRM